MLTYDSLKRFTRMPSYRVEVDLTYLEKHLERYINDLGLQMEPDFQRAHVWTEEQQVRFVEYLLRGGFSGRELYFNHPNWQGSYAGELVLVDGKQRLTAVRRFLAGEIVAFDHYVQDVEKAILRRATLHFNVNSLKTRAEVLQWYLDLNDGGTPHTKEEIERVRALLEREGK